MRKASGVSVLLVLLLVGGCGVFKGKTPAQTGQGLLPGEYWRVEPVAMRIYPTTRFMRRDGQILLMARVELLDGMNDSIKGVGQFTFELFDADNDGGSGRRLYAWTITALTLADQQQFYEPVPRAYGFPLLLRDTETATRRTSLRVTFAPPPGRGVRLETQAVIGELSRQTRPAEAEDGVGVTKPVKPE